MEQTQPLRINSYSTANGFITVRAEIELKSEIKEDMLDDLGKIDEGKLKEAVKKAL